MSILKKISLTSLSNILNIIFPILTLPWILKTLSLESYGQFLVVSSLVGLVALFSDLGISTVATRDVSRIRGKSSEVAELAGKFVSTQLILYFSVGIVLLVYQWVFRLENILSTCLFLIHGLLILLVPSWLINALDLHKSNFKALLVSKLGYVLFVFLFVRDSDDLNEFIFCGISSSLIYFLLFYLDSGFRFKVRVNVMKLIEGSMEIARNSYPYIISKLSIASYTVFIPLILSIFFSRDQIALYGVAERIRSMVFSLSFPLYALALAESSATDNDRDTAKRHILLASLIVLFSIFAFFILYFFGVNILNIVGGERYVEAIELLRVQAFIGIVISISSLLFNFYVVPSDKGKFVLWISSIVFFLSPFTFFTARFGNIESVLQFVLFIEVIILLSYAVVTVFLKTKVMRDDRSFQSKNL